MAKVIEFYVRDLFPRTVKRAGSRPGQVVEFPRCFKHLPSICLGEILNTENWCRKQEAATPGTRLSKENKSASSKAEKHLSFME